MNSSRAVLVMSKVSNNELVINLFTKANITSEKLLKNEIFSILEVTNFFKIKKTFKIISSYVFGKFRNKNKLMKVVRAYKLEEFRVLPIYDQLVKMPITKMSIKDKIMRYVRKIIDVYHPVSDVRIDETDEDSDHDNSTNIYDLSDTNNLSYNSITAVECEDGSDGRSSHIKTNNSSESGTLVLSHEQRSNITFLKQHSSWPYEWIMHDRILYDDNRVCGHAVGDFIINRSINTWFSSTHFSWNLEPTISRISEHDKYRDLKTFNINQLPQFYEDNQPHMISQLKWRKYNEGKLLLS